MGMTVCKKCGNRTNTALIDHDQDGKCLAFFDPNLKEYTKGCGYETADSFGKESADGIIRS